MIQSEVEKKRLKKEMNRASMSVEQYQTNINVIDVLEGRGWKNI